MKLGIFAIKLIISKLAREVRKRKKSWPNPLQYRPRPDVDALGDGVFEHQFDIYYAKEETPKKGTIVDIHGGAYLFGNRKHNFGYAAVFLEKGYDVVLLDYQPNNGVSDCQQQLQTVAKQLRYLFDHADELGLDRERIYLFGDSAGGHFALTIAEASCDPAYAKKLGINLKDISFRAAVVSCPVYDFEGMAETSLLSDKAKKYMVGPPWNDSEYKKLMSPKLHLSSLNIPVFLSSCRNDFIKAESLALDADAKAAGKNLTLLFLETKDRAVAHVHNVIAPTLPESVEVNDAAERFLDSL